MSESEVQTEARRIAAAPTADVAIVQAARAWKAKRDQLQYPPPPTRVDDLDVQNTSLPEARALYEAVAAAPEGVDAADELADAERWARQLVESEFQPPGPGLDRMRTLLDAADERRQLVDLVKLGEEKQRLLADELAAAQAAIQRVRAVCLGRRNVATVAVLKALGDLRALDGDTTEEKR